MKIRLRDILYIVLSSLLMVILLFHSSFRIRGRYEVNITVWCYMHCLFLWLSFGEWGRLFDSHLQLTWICVNERVFMFFPYAGHGGATPWIQSMFGELLNDMQSTLELLKSSLWGSCSIWCKPIEWCDSNQGWQCVQEGWSTEMAMSQVQKTMME